MRKRTEKVVQLLNQLNEHQILFFTCHEHLLKYFNDEDIIRLHGEFIQWQSSNEGDAKGDIVRMTFIQSVSFVYYLITLYFHIGCLKSRRYE